PLVLSNVETQRREHRVGLNRAAGESLPRSIYPEERVCGIVCFTKRVDHVQMSGIDPFAVGKTIHVFRVTRGGFSKPAHAQQGSGAEVQRLAALFGRAVVLDELIENTIAVLVNLLEKIRA